MYKYITISILAFAAIFLTSCEQTDAELLRKIELQSDSIPANLTLTVLNKHVYIDGVVMSDSMSEFVEKQIKNTEGVKDVTNNLKVIPGLIKKSSKTLDDDDLKIKIQEALMADGFESVKIEVKAGEVVVKGKVSAIDSLRVLNIIQSLAPKKVVNQLTINRRVADENNS